MVALPPSHTGIPASMPHYPIPPNPLQPSNTSANLNIVTELNAESHVPFPLVLPCWPLVDQLARPSLAPVCSLPYPVGSVHVATVDSLRWSVAAASQPHGLFTPPFSHLIPPSPCKGRSYKPAPSDTIMWAPAQACDSPLPWWWQQIEPTSPSSA